MTLRTNIQGGEREQGSRVTDFMATLDNARWMQHARCTEVDPELFFPVSGAAAAGTRAKAVCRTCPVIAQCAQYAIERPELEGIWGGTTANDRRDIRAEQPARPFDFRRRQAREWMERRNEALRLRNGGMTVRAIANELGVTERTAARYLSETRDPNNVAALKETA